MIVLDEFPLDLFPPRTFQPRLMGTGLSGGASFMGPGQTANWSGGGWWEGEAAEIQLNRKDQLLAWRAMLMRLANGVAEGVMPIIDPVKPYPAEYPMGAPGTPFSDESPWSDDTLNAAPVIQFYAEAAEAEATELTLTRLTGKPLVGGEFFTLNHDLAGPRLYCIASLTPEVGGARTITFGPPLRDAVAPGAFVDFERLRLVMRLATQPADIWPKLERPYRARPSLTFVESFSYQDAL